MGISAQVLQEFFDAATRKQRLGISGPRRRRSSARWWEFPVTSKLVQQAIEQKSQHGISCWDAAIVAAAHELGCEVLFSEDLNHE